LQTLFPYTTLFRSSENSSGGVWGHTPPHTQAARSPPLPIHTGQGERARVSAVAGTCPQRAARERRRARGEGPTVLQWTVGHTDLHERVAARHHREHPVLQCHQHRRHPHRRLERPPASARPRHEARMRGVCSAARGGEPRRRAACGVASVVRRSVLRCLPACAAPRPSVRLWPLADSRNPQRGDDVRVETSRWCAPRPQAIRRGGSPGAGGHPIDKKSGAAAQAEHGRDDRHRRHALAAIRSLRSRARRSSGRVGSAGGGRRTEGRF
jgi:hypothetical protein